MDIDKTIKKIRDLFVKINCCMDSCYITRCGNAVIYNNSSEPYKALINIPQKLIDDLWELLNIQAVMIYIPSIKLFKDNLNEYSIIDKDGVKDSIYAHIDYLKLLISSVNAWNNLILTNDEYDKFFTNNDIISRTLHDASNNDVYMCLTKSLIPNIRQSNFDNNVRYGLSTENHGNIKIICLEFDTPIFQQFTIYGVI